VRQLVIVPVFIAWTAMLGPKTSADDDAPVAEAIRVEATRSNFDREGRPLPLACSWHCGIFRSPVCAGWRPAHQLTLIEEGHHLLPWFAHPPRAGHVPEDPENFLIKYYREPIQRARRLRLPITFVGSQWESGLSDEPYLSRPAAENPNVVTADGRILKKVSPFGPVQPWREIGEAQTDNPWMKKLQQWYPNPPLVIFLSNNEHAKLAWHEAEASQRYLQKYGKGRDDDFKRRVVADGWIKRYRALQEGMRAGLQNSTWRKNAIFVGYSAFGPEFIGRWGGWSRYSLHSAERIDPSPLMWDGGSPSYYTHDWNPSRDDTVWSPQVEFMNLVFMKRDALRLNPRFWFEFSVWDGYHARPPSERKWPAKRAVYRKEGHEYVPERYAGFVQFGMWLLRPRAVRDFRGWTEPWEDVVDENGKVVHEGGGPYFLALVEAVDRVHANPVLRHWWRKGRLVPNRAHKHPYQAAIPKQWQDEDRWFLLDADVNPQVYPWKLDSQVNVFALALVQGERPDRQWLIYAHSPHGDRRSVKLRVPHYRPITVSVSRAGSFYLVDERTGRATLVE